MVRYTRGHDSYLHVICQTAQDKTCRGEQKTPKKDHSVGTNTAIYVSSALSLHPLHPRQLLIISTLSPLGCLLCMYDANTDVKKDDLLGKSCDCCVLQWVALSNDIQLCAMLQKAALEIIL